MITVLCPECQEIVSVKIDSTDITLEHDVLMEPGNALPLAVPVREIRAVVYASIQHSCMKQPLSADM